LSGAGAVLAFPLADLGGGHVQIRVDASQESKWKRAAKISGMSLDEWAGMHLDICAALALASVEFCELCGHDAGAPCETQQVFELPDLGDQGEGRNNELEARVVSSPIDSWNR